MALPTRRLLGGAALLAVALAVTAPPASAQKLERLNGYRAPATPAKYNKVGVLKFGSSRARNILVLNPGTSASAAYFAPLAETIVDRNPRWQVWAVERRENLLEDHSAANEVKRRAADGRRLYEYYLGWIGNGSITDHMRLIPDSEVGFARNWGMRVEVEDLRRVVRSAQRGKRTVVVGGHSLGGSITSAYATWDFGGKPGARGLAGLVFIDGGSGPTPVTVDQANASLQELAGGSPWLAFGGIQAPFAGLFNIVAAGLVKVEPDARNRFEDFAALPANLRAPVPVTNVGGYGYALDVETSPPGLRAAQANLGRLADSGDPRGWNEAGELTPIQRYADMFFGTGLRGLDGTAWYHPRRLTIDSGAVAAGNANPAQRVLDVRATHGDDLPRHLRMYAFGASLGGQRVLDAARVLARQSRIPRRQLTLVNRASTYSHNDPSSAFPRNDFVRYLMPFLRRVQQR
jgi:hypothetical protein